MEKIGIRGRKDGKIGGACQAPVERRVEAMGGEERRRGEKQEMNEGQTRKLQGKIKME